MKAAPHGLHCTRPCWVWSTLRPENGWNGSHLCRKIWQISFRNWRAEGVSPRRKWLCLQGLTPPARQRLEDQPKSKAPAESSPMTRRMATPIAILSRRRWAKSGGERGCPNTETREDIDVGNKS